MPIYLGSTLITPHLGNDSSRLVKVCAGEAIVWEAISWGPEQDINFENVQFGGITMWKCRKSTDGVWFTLYQINGTTTTYIGNFYWGNESYGGGRAVCIGANEAPTTYQGRQAMHIANIPTDATLFYKGANTYSNGDSMDRTYCYRINNLRTFLEA